MPDPAETGMGTDRKTSPGSCNRRKKGCVPLPQRRRADRTGGGLNTDAGSLNRTSEIINRESEKWIYGTVY